MPDLEPTSEGDYLTDVLTDKAIAVIEEQASAKRPFFVNLWYHTVHTPIEGKPELGGHYRRKIKDGHRQRNPHYAAMVHSMDENIGRVLAKLEDLGLRQNTLVVFSSDNGGFTRFCKLNKGLQVANNTPLRSGKGSCYEGGIRVPLIVRGPGVASNRTCSTPVISCDLFHTFLDTAQITERPDGPTDGQTLLPLLRDPQAGLDRDTSHFHYPHYYSTTTPVGAIRHGQWELLEYYEDRPLELYRLKLTVNAVNS